MYLKGHKSISIFCKVIPIHLLTTKLPTWKHSATVAREARVQAQEVGVISLTRFNQGDTGWGDLHLSYTKLLRDIYSIHLELAPYITHFSKYYIDYYIYILL